MILLISSNGMYTYQTTKPKRHSIDYMLFLLGARFLGDILASCNFLPNSSSFANNKKSFSNPSTFKTSK